MPYKSHTGSHSTPRLRNDMLGSIRRDLKILQFMIVASFLLALATIVGVMRI